MISLSPTCPTLCTYYASLLHSDKPWKLTNHFSKDMKIDSHIMITNHQQQTQI